MKHAVRAVRASVLFLLVLLFAFVPVTAVGGENIIGENIIIDDMSSSSGWSSASGQISQMRYGTDTEHMSSGEEDTGYLAVRDYDMMSGTPLEISRSFSMPLDLFEYDALGFYINISDVGVEGASYLVTVTLYSSGPSYSHESACGAGEWVRIYVPVGEYTLRTDIVGISVSVTVVTDEPVPVRLSYRLDGIETAAGRDTSAEEQFLCPSFESRGGIIAYDDGGFYSLPYSSGRCRVIGNPTIRQREVPGAYDVIRYTVSSEKNVTAELAVTYFGGVTYTTDTVRLEGGGVMTALCFRVDEIEKVYSLSLNIYGDGEGELRLYGAELLTLPKTTEEGIGTVDTCRMLADGGINLRGTVPSETVADYMDGSIAVFCVPIYGDAAEYITEAEPCAERDVTTRFDITISADKLPTGYRAMRFVTAICRGDERIIIAKPKLPTFSEEVGARLPASRAGIKGMMSAGVASGAAVTFIDADIEELFGTASSGKLYSFGGRVYYFDNGCIAGLDEKIRTASLTGTSCFIRLFDSDKGGGYDMITADGEEDFAALYAAVDYLTSRYSSQDYGFISGISVDDGIYKGSYGGESLSSRASSCARMLSAVYQTGRGNIAGFRVVFPIGDKLADTGTTCDAASMLLGLSVAMDEFGEVPYDVMMTSEEPIVLFDAVLSYAGSLGKNAPGGYYVVYIPENAGSAKSLLADYAENYYSASTRESIGGFLLSFDTDTLPGADEFLKYFFLLDTNEYAEAEAYAGIAGEDAPSFLTHPVTVTRGRAGGGPGTITGSYDIFDFTDSFDTAGWFPVSGDGECLTVRTASGRALRADAASLGAIYSCALSPRDLSATPVLSIEAYSPDVSEYELTVYSASGIYRAEISLWGYSSTYCVDLSGFAGITEVTGISLSPRGEGGTLYISRISVCSFTLDDAAVRDIFAPAQTGDGTGDGEDNMLEIMAVSLLSLAAGAAAVAVLGGRTRRRRGQEQQ